MERERTLQIARELGWRVTDLNDNERGLRVKGPNWQVSCGDDYVHAYSTEDDAWEAVIKIITGKKIAPLNDMRASVLVREMLDYLHPSFMGTRYESPEWRKMNVMAWTERLDGSPTEQLVYKFAVGIMYSMQYPPKTINMAGFCATSDTNDFDGRNSAIEQVYTDFKTWAETQTASPQTWQPPSQPECD